MAAETQARHRDFAARIRPLLEQIYPADRYPADLASRLSSRIVERVAEAHPSAARSSVGRDPFERCSAMLITYGDSIVDGVRSPLAVLTDFAESRLRRAFSHVHVLPFFPSSSDGGFAVKDYRTVEPRLGTWEDVESLGRSFRLGFDLVLNHASSQGRWFEAMCAGNEPERDYFLCPEPDFDTRDVMRPRESPLLTEFETALGRRRLWTTFGPDQVDLDYRSPELLLEVLDIVALYLARGARLLRLDAVAYLWKESGTRCVHLPQTHAVIKLIRAFVEALEPECLVLTETNVPHTENVSYLADGDEAHLVYLFSLPPLLLHAIDTSQTRYLCDWARQLGAPPAGTSFLNFTASHDGIGLRPIEGLVPDMWIERMLDRMTSRGALLSHRVDRNGRRIPYELNSTYFDACAGRSSTAESHERRFLLTQAVTATLQGVPAVYIHSLFATANDVAAVERTGVARSINRSTWQLAELERVLAEPGSRHSRIFGSYLELLERRSAVAALRPTVPQHVFELEGRIFGVLRTPSEGTGRALLALFNLSGTAAWLRLDALPAAARNWVPFLHNGVRFVEDGRIHLSPYAFGWLLDGPSEPS